MGERGDVELLWSNSHWLGVTQGLVGDRLSYHLHLPENQEEAKSDLQVTQIHWNAKERRIRASERKTWMCQKIRADKGEFFKG